MTGGGAGRQELIVIDLPPAGRCLVGFGFTWPDVLVFAALGEWAASAEQDGELVVEVVA